MSEILGLKVGRVCVNLIFLCPTTKYYTSRDGVCLGSEIGCRNKESRVLKVKMRSGESVQQMIRRFKKLCEKEGLIRDMKRTAYYEKPSERERRRMRKAQRIIRH